MRHYSRPLMLALLALGCASPPPPCDAASFGTFWSAFQSAAMQGTVSAVQQSVRFPLSTRGQMDGDPILQHAAESFPPLWEQLLEQDAGLRMEPETLREFIARHASPPADAFDSLGREARVADLVFTCNAGRWQLTTAYTSK